jgi:hypothetical protein
MTAPLAPTTKLDDNGQASSHAREASSWLASETQAGPEPQPTRAEPPVLPAADLTPLPELLRWHSSSVAQLSRDMIAGIVDLERVGDLSQRIDLSILDQLDSRRLGRVFTYKQQCFGDIVQNLIPRLGHEEENSNAGRKAFGWHSDDARLDVRFRVDNLGLFGVDNRGGVPTRLLAIDDVITRLDRRTRSRLARPDYTQAVPQSYRIDQPEDLRSPGRPVLVEARDGYHIRYTSYATRPAHGNAAAEAALQALHDAVHAATPREIVLGAGDMLVFSNSRFLHSRGAVGGQRWIKRVYLKRDLRELTRFCSTERTAVFDVLPAIHASSEPMPS